MAIILGRSKKPGDTNDAIGRRENRRYRRRRLGRIGEVEDVVDAVLYLAGAGYVTGEVISVDGGLRFNS